MSMHLKYLHVSWYFKLLLSSSFFQTGTSWGVPDSWHEAPERTLSSKDFSVSLEKSHIYSWQNNHSCSVMTGVIWSGKSMEPAIFNQLAVKTPFHKERLKNFFLPLHVHISIWAYRTVNFVLTCNAGATRLHKSFEKSAFKHLRGWCGQLRYEFSALGLKRLWSAS